MEVILHYVFKLVVFTFASSICWIVLVMYSSFPRPWSGRVFLTSFKSVCIYRPCVGRIEYLFVHGLDMLNIYTSIGWTVLKSFAQGFYLVLYLDEYTL